MSLFSRASQPNPAYQQALQHLLTAASGLQHKVEHELPVLLAEKSTDVEYFTPALTELQQALTAVKQHIKNPTLVGKTIVAFGGAFSAGKSSLINALIGEERLQTQIDPTTSVPTYVCAGEAEAINATNLFEQQIELSAAEFAQITHDEQNTDTCISGLLRSITLQTPKFKWKNLAVLDTPGYSKPAQGSEGERTDAQIAREQLNAADVIVWVVSAEAGGISEDELAFLKQLKADTPKLLVINRADKKTTQELLDIQSLVQKICAQQQINILGIITTSARKPSEYPLKALTDWFDQWDASAPIAQQQLSTLNQDILSTLYMQLRYAHYELAAVPLDAVTTLEIATQQQRLLAETEQALTALTALITHQVFEKINEFNSIADAQAEENKQREQAELERLKAKAESHVNKPKRKRLSEIIERREDDVRYVSKKMYVLDDISGSVRKKVEKAILNYAYDFGTEDYKDNIDPIVLVDLSIFGNGGAGLYITDDALMHKAPGGDRFAIRLSKITSIRNDRDDCEISVNGNYLGYIHSHFRSSMDALVECIREYIQQDKQ